MDAERDCLERMKHVQPDWDYIIKRSGDLPFGHAQLHQTCMGMNCNEAIAAIIQMLPKDGVQIIKEKEVVYEKSSISQKMHLEEKQTYFVGLGTKSHVARYLRYTGRIINRKFSLDSCVSIINDVWDQKSKYPDVVKMSHFFYLYLSKRFQVSDLIVEHAYNIVDACKQYKDRSFDCYSFLEILEDRMDEEVHFDVLSLVNGLKHTNITKKQFKDNIQLKFRYKTSRQMAELMSAIDSDYQDEIEETFDGAFFRIVKIQELEDRARYLKELESAIIQYHGTGITSMTGAEFLRIICKFDVDKRKQDAMQYVARGFQAPIDKIRDRETITAAKFIANLSRGILHRG